MSTDNRTVPRGQKGRQSLHFMSVYVFKWDAWVAKRKDAGRFTIIYDESVAQVDRLATIRIRAWTIGRPILPRRRMCRSKW